MAEHTGCDVAFRAATSTEPRAGAFRGFWERREEGIALWNARRAVRAEL